MPHSNGQHEEQSSLDTANDTPRVSKIEKLLWPAQAKFLEDILFMDVEGLSQSLKHVHELALYYTQVDLGENEKQTLMDVKLLWECLDSLKENELKL